MKTTNYQAPRYERFEVFTSVKANTIFSGYQLSHQTLMMKTEMVPETTAIFNQLTRLASQEDFINPH
jgi:hypothetical protein